MDVLRWIGPLGTRAACLTAALVITGCNTTPVDESVAWSPEKLYAEAKDEMAAGAMDKAAKLLERLEGRAAGTPLAQQAQVERAYVLWRSGERAQALSALERFLKLNPSSPGVEYALYLQGLINFNDNLGILGGLASIDLSERDQQAARDSYQSFKQLVDQFPRSVYAEDSQVRMNYIVNSLAAYEVHVARYYYRRGAYVAAANRAQQAVQEFQYSPSTEEALAIMVQSYDRLGLAELRDDASATRASAAPASSAAGGASGRPGSGQSEGPAKLARVGLS
jgi:outer membrane protein assembly factor BamD